MERAGQLLGSEARVTQTTRLDSELFPRCSRRCELCAAVDDLRIHATTPVTDVVADRCAVVCGGCAAELDSTQPLDAEGCDGLEDAAWSRVPAVLVLVLRLLPRLRGPWASELLGQIYVDDDVRARAAAGAPDHDDDNASPIPVDCNGTPLAEGDSVSLIQDLDVKGANFVAKRGTLVKGIRLSDDPAYVDGKVNNSVIMLKTKFLKKA